MSRYDCYNQDTTVKRFDSPEDYREFLLPARGYDGGSWGGSWRVGCDKLLHGDTKNLARAMEIIDQMQDAHVFSEGLPVYAPAIVGSFANVPATIMGHPMDMFAKQSIQLESEVSPITIYVETVTSGGLSVAQLNSRGVACLAFALAMNNIRPVEIYVTSSLGDGRKTSVIATRIASSPMDMPRAVFMLTDEAYSRSLNFGAANHLTGSNSMGSRWGWSGAPTDDEYIANMRKYLNMEPQDVYIPGGYLLDHDMLNNPIQWVKDMIAQHGGNKDE